jgi:outer membrane protein assembly factor BamB
MGIYGTPWVRNEKIYVGAYDGSVLWVSTDGTAVSRSKFETEGPIVGGVTIDGETLYVGSSDGNLYALDLNVADLSDSLKEGWPFKTGGKIWSTPVVSDNVVYLASADHNLYAIDAESGNEVWRFETEAAIMSTPLVAYGKVYIGGCDRKFYAVEAATEPERRAASLREQGSPPEASRDSPESVFAEAGNWFWTQALAYNGEIWVGNLDHRVYVLNAEDVEEEVCDAYPTGGMVRTPPVLFPAEGLVVVGSQDGKIYAIDAQTKDVTVYAIDAKTEEVVEPPDRPKKPLSPIFAPMFADQRNGVLYFHSQNGTHTLYAFELSTKEVLWTFRTDKISD